MRKLVSSALVSLSLGLGACSGDDGGGGIHFPRPDFYAGRATLWREGADVEIIAQNDTDAPLWIRRLDLTLSTGGQPLARGVWEGDRLIDPATSVMMGINLPLVEGAAAPSSDTPGELRIDARYARSGVIGLLGGETHDYTLPIVVRRGKGE